MLASGFKRAVGMPAGWRRSADTDRRRRLLPSTLVVVTLVATVAAVVGSITQLVRGFVQTPSLTLRHSADGRRDTGRSHRIVALATTTTGSQTSDADCTVAGRDAGALANDAKELLQEIVEVVMSTGLQSGFARTAMAARAAALTAADIAREPPAAINDAFIAKVLRTMFERLGATYIKLGQFIASSPTVFPPDYVREFQRCLDNSITVSFAEIRDIIQKDLGRPLSQVFAYVDPVPLASASIAQVHAATLLTGEDVVVKVQKPGIEDVLSTDLGFVYIAARILGFVNPDLNTRGSLSDIVSDLRISMLGELDFTAELDNLEVFRAFLVDNGLDSVAVAPKPYKEFSSKKVLTMERLRGVAMVDLEGIRKYAADPEATLVAALNVWSLSVQRCDFFHADLHAGNLLVLEDGRVGFLDFGIVGRLPPKVSTGVDMLNVALAVGDAKGMARALISMGATVGKVDEDSFAADIEKLLSRLGRATGPVAAGSATASGASSSVDEAQIQDIVLDIAQVAGNNGLKLPREFGLLIKQALYFDRYTKLLAPELDMMSDSRIARLGGGGGAADGAEVVIDTEAGNGTSAAAA